jgi:hypothetical protein
MVTLVRVTDPFRLNTPPPIPLPQAVLPVLLSGPPPWALPPRAVLPVRVELPMTIVPPWLKIAAPIPAPAPP